jgi:FKBP-type peptidyl-prolyl cis-trans isomerase FklB
MRTIFLVLLMGLSITAIQAQKKKKQAVFSLTNINDSVSYCIGVSIGNALKSQNIEGLNPEVIAKGMAVSIKGENALISLEDAENFLREHFTAKQQAESNKKLQEANNFLENNKKTEGINELPSGLQYKVVAEGEGEKPGEQSKVKVHYKGYLINGTVFDSSYERGEPAEFEVSGLIPGFTEALLNMKKGSKWTIYIPPHLAYGEQGTGGGIGPNEVLIFDIELFEILANEIE